MAEAYLNAAGEVCPIWPGHPVTAQWGVEDPAALQGSAGKKREAFQREFRTLATRIDLLTRLPLGSLGRSELKEKLSEIARATSASRR